MVYQWQSLLYNERHSQTLLGNSPDFVKLAEAFGASAFRATTQKEFKNAFEKAVKLGGPVLIDTVIDKDEMVLPMLPPGGSIDDIIVSIDKEGENE